MKRLLVLLYHRIKMNYVMFARCDNFNVGLAIFVRSIDNFIIVVSVWHPAVLSLIVPFPHALMTRELFVDGRFAFRGQRGLFNEINQNEKRCKPHGRQICQGCRG